MTRPLEAVETYLDSRKTEVAESTVASHRSRLQFFVKWCQQQSIDTMGDLTPLHMTQYRTWRRDDGNLSPASEKTQMDTLRVFVKWCERMQIVQDNLSDAVESPSLSNDENSRDVHVDEDEAEAILENLDRYSYASRKHVIVVLLWATGLRTCSIHSLDLDDFNAEDDLLELRHLPDQGTSLKNQAASERYVSIQPETTAILEDYIKEHRIDNTGEHGRQPLLTSKHGRLGKSAVRKYSYSVTRPCEQGVECPHDRDPDDCEATQQIANAYSCPSSKSPHTWRRGHITHLLRNDVPPEVVSGRADVSPDVIEDHYDERDERQRANQRRQYLDNI